MHVALLQRNTEVIRLVHLGEPGAQKCVLGQNFEKLFICEGFVRLVTPRRVLKQPANYGFCRKIGSETPPKALQTVLGTQTTHF